MPEAVSTRVSLLLRLRDRSDSEAWSLFVEIYGPLIFSFARRCGLQDSDAADLVQEVMGEVAKSIVKFDYDPQVGKFRSWLYAIAKRTIWRIQKRPTSQPSGTGDSRMIQMLQNHPDPHQDLEAMWDREYQQQLIDWAATQIQGQFREATWRAFWLTSVEQRSAEEVAGLTGMPIGSVYVAKSRVLKRLIDKIREIDDSQ